jgi:hypothetical protein
MLSLILSLIFFQGPTVNGLPKPNQFPLVSFDTSIGIVSHSNAHLHLTSASAASAVTRTFDHPRGIQTIVLEARPPDLATAQSFPNSQSLSTATVSFVVPSQETPPAEAEVAKRLTRRDVPSQPSILGDPTGAPPAASTVFTAYAPGIQLGSSSISSISTHILYQSARSTYSTSVGVSYQPGASSAQPTTSASSGLEQVREI